MKRYTQQEIEVLRQNPNVKDIRENRLTPTFEFRLKMYEEWALNPSTGTIRKVLFENGFDPRIVGTNWIRDQNRRFKRNGKPTKGKNKNLTKDSDSSPTYRGRENSRYL